VRPPSRALAAELGERGAEVSCDALWRYLRARRITFKNIWPYRRNRAHHQRFAAWMRKPRSDEAASEPRRPVASGCNVMFFAILVLLLAVLIAIAWHRTPPDAPDPAATVGPEELRHPLP
jgi:hypothetical protein